MSDANQASNPMSSPISGRIGTRGTLAAAAVGLLAVGALAGGLITRHTDTSPEPVEPVRAVAAQSNRALPPAKAPVQAPVLATRQAVAAVCATCGVVESVRIETRKGQATGVGAVAGGVLGGVLGNQFGGGDGRKVMTVAGALGGGLAGNEIEKHQRGTTVYVATVRMDDGSLRTFTRSASLATGQRVKVEGQSLQLVPS